MSASAPLPVARTTAELREVVAAWRRDGARVGFVPSMGALHEGHLSLVRRAREEADRVVASVFVNPKQFAAHEDLYRYPRREAEDSALLASAGCDLLFAPGVLDMYPQGFATAITVGGPSEGLETDHRPHFFQGVATVVAKLLIQVGADAAVFGEKDFQQLLVVERLVRDLDLPVRIVRGETVREADGLALSSRNAYLSPEERRTAAALFAVLRTAAERIRAGEAPGVIEAHGRAALLEAGFAAVDYVAVRRASDLSAFDRTVDGPARVLGAAWLGSTRLIDNLEVGNAAPGSEA